MSRGTHKTLRADTFARAGAPTSGSAVGPPGAPKNVHTPQTPAEVNTHEVIESASDDVA
jgi:hypothetical protein